MINYNYLARDLTGETMIIPGKKFGNILRAAISQRYIAFDEQMKKTKQINLRMMKIRRKILDNQSLRCYSNFPQFPQNKISDKKKLNIFFI